VEAAAFVLNQISGLIYRHYIQGRYVCACFGEAARDALSETSRCTRYQRDLAVQVEVVEDAH
jgi:hypothetical protein